jgi:peptidoglycan hydrolase FlgJ
MLTATSATTQPMEQAMLAIKENAIRPASGFKLRGNTKLSPEKIDAAAQEFEAQFISQMLSSMYATVDPTESLGGSDSEEVYNSLLINEYGKVIARTGGVGVADHVKRLMIDQQEVSKPTE